MLCTSVVGQPVLGTFVVGQPVLATSVAGQPVLDTLVIEYSVFGTCSRASQWCVSVVQESMSGKRASACGDSVWLWVRLDIKGVALCTVPTIMLLF